MLYTHIGIVVTTFCGRLFDLIAHGNLFEFGCDSAPDDGFPPTLGLVTSSLLREQRFNKNTVVVR